MNNYEIKLENIKHLELIYHIINNFYDLPLNVKGGTTLLFAYGSNRYTKDIDLDAPYRINLKEKINQIKLKDFNIINIFYKKKENNNDEYKILYSLKDEFFSNKLKIDYSFREINFNNLNYIFKNNVRFSDLKYIFNTKIIALQNRNKFSDLYDLFFISYKYPFILNKNDLYLLNKIIENPNKLTQKFILNFSKSFHSNDIKFFKKDYIFYKDFFIFNNDENNLLKFCQNFKYHVQNLIKNYTNNKNLFIQNILNNDILNNEQYLLNTNINLEILIDLLKEKSKYKINFDKDLIKIAISNNPYNFEFLPNEYKLNKELIDLKNKSLNHLYNSNIFQNDVKIINIINSFLKNKNYEKDDI